jgi:hypothetical protein
MKKNQSIPIHQMIKTIKGLGFRFYNNQDEDNFINSRCQVQQTEHNGRPVWVLYIDRVKAGMYER